MHVLNKYKKKTTIRLFIAAHFILFYMLIPYNAYSGNLTDELISASENGDAAKVKDLVAKGVIVNEKDEYGSTALFYAVKNKKTSVDVVNCCLPVRNNELSARRGRPGKGHRFRQ